MKAVKVVVMVSALLAGIAVTSVVDAQEPRQQPDLRMLLSQPQGRTAPDASAPPDLRDLPQPKMDKPPVQPPITIIVGGDARCLPGEDDFGNSRFSRSRRSH